MSSEIPERGGGADRLSGPGEPDEEAVILGSEGASQGPGRAPLRHGRLSRETAQARREAMSLAAGGSPALCPACEREPEPGYIEMENNGPIVPCWLCNREKWLNARANDPLTVSEVYRRRLVPTPPERA